MLRLLFGGYANAFSFSGRERRRAYGAFLVIHLVTLFAGALLLNSAVRSLSYVVQELAFLIYFAVWLVPLVSMIVRRFHDNDTSGWLVLPGMLVFGIGLGAALVVAPRPVYSANRYGPDPRLKDEA